MQPNTNDAVGIFSNYSGENSGSCMTYSVLVSGYAFISAYSEKMKKIRERYERGQVEVSLVHPPSDAMFIPIFD